MSAAMAPVSSALVGPSNLIMSIRSLEIYGRKSRLARMLGISTAKLSSAQSEVTQHYIKSTVLSMYSCAIFSREMVGDQTPTGAEVRRGRVCKSVEMRVADVYIKKKT